MDSGNPSGVNPMHCIKAGPPVTLNGVVRLGFCQKAIVRQASSRGSRTRAGGEQHIVLGVERRHLRQHDAALALRLNVVGGADQHRRQRAAEKILAEVARARAQLVLVHRIDLGFGDRDLDVVVVASAGRIAASSSTAPSERRTP